MKFDQKLKNLPPNSPKSVSTRDVFLGLSISRVEKLPFSWILHFGSSIHLSVETSWRVLSPNSIFLTSEDDGQKFGLPKPLDADVELSRILGDHTVTSVEVDESSADLFLAFENGVVLQVINLSSGFEPWVVHRDDGLVLVGQNEKR